MTRFLSLILTMLLLPVLALGQSTAILDGIGLANGKSYTNYIKNPNAQKNTVNVTASNLTVARSIITPLYSTAEFNLTSTSTPWSATWSALAFNEGMKNRLCEVQIMLRGTAAGTTTLEVLQNSVAVFTQTVTLDATNPKKYGGTFPCGDLTYASTVKLGGTGATTGAIEAGAVYLGEPVSVSSGAVVTEWQTSTVNVFEGTNDANSQFSTRTMYWRRTGDSLDFQFYGVRNANASSGTGVFNVQLPNGYIADALKTVAGGGKIGTAWSYKTSAVNFSASASVNSSLADRINFFVQEGGTSPTSVTIVTMDSSRVLMANGTVPISGWAATDIVTPEASISGQARYTTDSSPTQTITNSTNTIVNFEDKAYDINSEVTTGASWKFTAKTAGYYQVNAQVTLASSAAWGAGEIFAGYIYKGGATYSTFIGKAVDAGVTQSKSTQISDVIYLNAGEYFDIRVLQNSGSDIALESSGNNNQVSISKVTGPGSQSFYLQGPTKGGNSGNAIPAGYVGEVKRTSSTSTISQATPVADTWYDSGLSITVEPGSYLLNFSTHGQLDYSAWTSGFSGVKFAVCTGTTASPTIIVSGGYAQNISAAISIFNTVSASRTVEVSSTTTYKLFYSHTPYSSGTYTVSSIALRGGIHRTLLEAIRLD